jgi:hypothetical protein
MGVLTESMTRLRDEIVALRHDRQTLRMELERSTKAAQFHVSALRRTIASDLAGAHRAWTGASRVTPQPPSPHRGETRIPAHPAAAAPAPAKGLFKKHKKH